jgi:hypothetical protein
MTTGKGDWTLGKFPELVVRYIDTFYGGKRG